MFSEEDIWSTKDEDITTVIILIENRLSSWTNGHGK